MFEHEESTQSPKQAQTVLSNVNYNENEQMQIDFILISPSESQDHSIEIAPMSSIPSHLFLQSPANALYEKKHEGHTEKCFSPMILPRLHKQNHLCPPRCCLNEKEDDSYRHSHLEFNNIYVPIEASPKSKNSKPPLPPQPPSSSPTLGQYWPPTPPSVNSSINLPPPLSPCFRYAGRDPWTGPIVPFKLTIDNAWKASEMAQFCSNNCMDGNESMSFSSGDDSEEEEDEDLGGVKYLHADI